MNFNTGFFKFDDEKYINTGQKYHSTEVYNDNPMLWVRQHGMPYDGYVSNKGSVATIHIRKQCLNEDNINKIKRVFCLKPENGIDKVNTKILPEWLVLYKNIKI